MASGVLETLNRSQYERRSVEEGGGGSDKTVLKRSARARPYKARQAAGICSRSDGKPLK